jgi:hypothetical protein
MPLKKKSLTKRRGRGGSKSKFTKKRMQKGGGCSCDQKHFVGGYGPASFQGDPSKYTYAYNNHENDPLSPSNVTNARNLLGGRSRRLRKKQRGGAPFPDLLGKSSSSNFFSSFGTSNAASNMAQIENGQRASASGPYPTPTAWPINQYRPILV